MSSVRFANRVFTYFLDKKKAGTWLTQVRKESVGSTCEERGSLNRKLEECRGLQQKKKLKADRTWTKETNQEYRK